MILRRADILLLGALLFAVLTVGTKLIVAPRFVYPDRERLATAIVQRLEFAGYRVTRTEPIAPYRLRASRGKCRLAVQQVDPEAGEPGSFARRVRSIGPVHFHYRGSVSTAFPRFRPVLMDQLQRQSARLGLVFAIDPIVAVAASPDCTGLTPMLDGLRIHSSPGSAAIGSAR